MASIKDQADYIGYQIAWEQLPDGGYDFRVGSDDARLREQLQAHDGHSVCAFQAATLEAGIAHAQELIDEATPPPI